MMVQINKFNLSYIVSPRTVQKLYVINIAIKITKVSVVDGVLLWTVFPERAEVGQATDGGLGLWPVTL